MVFLFFSRWNKHVRLMVLHLFIYEAWRDEGKLLLLRFLSIYIVVDCCRLLNIRPDRTPSSLSIRPASYIEKYFYNRKAGPNDIESFSRCCMACPFDALQHARQHISQSERRDIGICELSIEQPDCIVLLYISPHLYKSLSLSLIVALKGFYSTTDSNKKQKKVLKIGAHRENGAPPRAIAASWQITFPSFSPAASGAGAIKRIYIFSGPT